MNVYRKRGTLVLVALLAACKADKGGKCGKPEDCASGLTCMAFKCVDPEQHLRAVEQDKAREGLRYALETVTIYTGPSCPGACPNIADIFTMDFFRNDYWGTRYEIKCTDRAVTVSSAGPDKKHGTSDDVALTGPCTKKDD